MPLAGADWTGCSLFGRIEAAFPVRDPELEKRWVEEGLEPYLADYLAAWEFEPDGAHAQVRPRGRQDPFTRRCAHMASRILSRRKRPW